MQTCLPNLSGVTEMSKNARKKRQKIRLEFDDNFDGLYDDDIDMGPLTQGRFGTDWEDLEYRHEKRDDIDARRKIERRRDMKRLYSELDEWEEFGSSADW
jgi:hypothetical protein